MKNLKTLQDKYPNKTIQVQVSITEIYLNQPVSSILKPKVVVLAKASIAVGASDYSMLNII